jgi:hypothetical protein
VRVAGRFVAWREEDVDISCKAACPPGYEATKRRIGVADLRARRIRFLSIAPTGRSLVVGKRGAVAWIEPADPSGVVLRASARDGDLRTLYSGAIKRGSLRIRGLKVSWVREGVRRSATLG